MPKRITITLSDSLAEAAEMLRKKRRYRSASEYIQGLIRYDGQTQKEHHLSAEYAAMSPWERDRLDDAILRQVQSGKGVKGSWLEARIREAVKSLSDKNGRAPTEDEVVEELRGN
jgi:Arc/MetJ-type ribon-helix-helix transcriptional regulator